MHPPTGGRLMQPVGKLAVAVKAVATSESLPVCFINNGTHQAFCPPTVPLITHCWAITCRAACFHWFAENTDQFRLSL